MLCAGEVCLITIYFDIANLLCYYHNSSIDSKVFVIKIEGVIEMVLGFSEKVMKRYFHPEVYVYPTPRTYRPLVGFNLSQAKFTKEINVYLHYPFCKQICSYCGYLKMVDQTGELRREYVDAWITEIRQYTEVISDSVIKTVHFGGGTPSMLCADDLEKVVRTLVEINPKLFETVEEVSIEATPESVEFEKFSRLKEIGFNRVSMGVQSMDEEELALCGRSNLFAVTANAIRVLREIGFGNIVTDLMIGIEGQTVDSFERSLISLLVFRPETVELYALGLMPNTKLGRTSTGLMQTADIYRCYDIGREFFLGSGYRQACHNRYEIPKRGSFLQEDYVFRGMSLIGIGAGVRTYADNIHYRNFYYRDNRKAVRDYIAAMRSGISAIYDGTFISDIEKLRQYAIYNIEELDVTVFRKRFGIPFDKMFRELLNEMISLGFIEKKGRFLKLTPKGLNFRDLIAEEMFSDEVKAVEDIYRPRM